MSVAISANMRNSLNALQTISSQSNTAQARLSSGLKVNSALDNPTSYFTAQGLNDRAGDLGTLLDGIGNGIQALKAADEGIKSISTLMQTAKGIAAAAKQAAVPEDLAAQFDAIMAQIDTLAKDSSFNGVNLIGEVKADALKVSFNEDGSSKVAISAVDLTTGADGLNIAKATSAWADVDAVEASIAEIDTALGTLRTTAAAFGANSAIMTARQDFTKGMISTLKTGADNLVLADQNEEATNLLALQTRQQLAQTSLSIANQSQQAVLRLF